MRQLPRVSDGVIVADTSGGAVVYEPTRGLLHQLNPEAALVLDGCLDGWALDSLATEIAMATGRAESEIHAEVVACVRELHDRRIVDAGAEDDAGEAAGAREDPPTATRVAAVRPMRGHHPEKYRSSPLKVIDEVIEFDSADSDLIELVDHWFADLIVTDPVTTRATLTPKSGRVGIRSADTSFRRFNGAAVRCHDLPAVLNSVAAHSTTCLALHAGVVVSPGGMAVVLPGVPGAGKSTLVAGLVLDGWSYLSDEVAAIRFGSLDLVPYPKPLSLSASSRLALDLPGEVTPSPFRGCDLRPHACRRPRELLAMGPIVIASWEPEAETSYGPIEDSDALRDLAPHVLNPQAAGKQGLQTLVELSESTPIFRLIRGDVVSARRALESLLASLGA